MTTDTSYIVRLRTSLQFFIGEGDHCELARKTLSCRASFSLLLCAATLSGTKLLFCSVMVGIAGVNQVNQVNDATVVQVFVVRLDV